MKKIISNTLIVLLSGLILHSCSDKNSTPQNELETRMNRIAENYAKLVLKVGLFDGDYVDAYFGPEDWRPDINYKDEPDAIQKIYDEAGLLLDGLDSLAAFKADDMQTLRFRYLYKQLLALRGKAFMLADGKFTFDEETKVLYDAEAPSFPDEHFHSIINELDALLPGSGDVGERLQEFKKDFIIPKEKLDAVFTAAIEECRKRTLRYITLPEEENFTVEYVEGQHWAAYNWYKGNSFSLIQVNTDLPVYIDRAVDLAAHEGYPGHHVYNVLLEKHLAKERGWVEFTVYALFSPQSLIAEGTANYGIEVAFPCESRIQFEKEVLFPLAGIDPAKAEQYYKVLELTSKLSYASNEAARKYLDGELTRDEAKLWLQKYRLASPERSEQNLRFIEKYRSYVINYNLGQDIVKDYIERNGGTADNPRRRWELFKELLSTPRTPSGLMRD